MNRILIIILLFIFSSVQATDWYFDSEGGNDADNGLTVNTPKKSATALQACFNSLTSVDRVYLKRGSSWNDYAFTLTGRNGSAGNPIQILAYGTGNAPILHCFENISGTWAETSDRWGKTLTTTNRDKYKWIWYGENGNTADGSYIRNYINYLLIDGVPYSIGRYPNTGYLSFESISSDGRSTATDYSASWASNYWQFGELQFMPGALTGGGYQWMKEWVTITGNSSNTLNLTTGDFYTGSYLSSTAAGGSQKYFITNHPNCNDVNGEWSYNYLNGTISVYHTGDVNTMTIELPRYNYALYINDCSYIIFDGIQFEGGITETVQLRVSDHITFQNCTIRYSPHTAISNYSGVDNSFINNIIDKSCNGGLYDIYGTRTIISDNEITDIGVDETMGGDRDLLTYIGVYSYNRKGTVTITDNYIDSTGYAGIAYRYPAYTSGASAYSFDISNNIIYSSCQTLCDGGAIYIVDQSSVGTVSRIVKKNIIKTTTNNSAINYYPTDHIIIPAIYLDVSTYGVDIDSNTIYGCSSGFYNHPSISVDFRYNNIFNAGSMSNSVWPAGFIGTQNWYGHGGISTQNLNVKKNTIVNTKTTNFFGQWQYDGTFNGYGSTVDSNWYYNPRRATSASMFSRILNYNNTSLNVTQWREITGFDINSTINKNGTDYTSTPEIADESLIKLVTNLSPDSTRTVDLYDFYFLDKDGNTVRDSIVLQPKESKFLFRVLPYGTVSMGLIRELDWGTGELGNEPGVSATDTLFFEEYTSANNVDVVMSADCGDSTVIRYISGGAGSVTDTLAKINFAGTDAYWDLSGWTKWGNGVDSVLISTGSYIHNHTTELEYNGQGEPSTVWPFLVSTSYWFLSNANNDSVYYVIDGLSSDYTYTLIGISSRDNASASPPRPLYMSVGNDRDTVESVGNTSNVLMIDSISPVGDSIVVSFDRANGQYGYINGLIILRTQTLSFDNSQSWVQFSNVNFGTGMDSIRYAVDFNQGTGVKSFELRLDNPTGTLVDSFVVAGTGCGIRGAALTSEVTGVHDLYVLIDTLDQYHWLKFYDNVAAATYHNITDTFYIYLANEITSGTKSYNATCGDTIISGSDIYANFYNILYDQSINTVDIKLNSYPETPYSTIDITVVDGYNYYLYTTNITDTISDCSIITIPLTFNNVAIPVGTIIDNINYTNYPYEAEVAWMYFYYRSPQQLSIHNDSGVKYKINRLKMIN